jgi:hypothetical protein
MTFVSHLRPRHIIPTAEDNSDMSCFDDLLCTDPVRVLQSLIPMSMTSAFAYALSLLRYTSPIAFPGSANHCTCCYIRYFRRTRSAFAAGKTWKTAAVSIQKVSLHAVFVKILASIMVEVAVAGTQFDSEPTMPVPSTPPTATPTSFTPDLSDAQARATVYGCFYIVILLWRSLVWLIPPRHHSSLHYCHRLRRP